MTAPEPDDIAWRTSSDSGTNGACVKVGWRSSSYCYEYGGCLEVAPAPAGVLVRDSKDPAGPTLAVTTAQWQAFLTTVTR